MTSKTEFDNKTRMAQTHSLSTSWDWISWCENNSIDFSYEFVDSNIRTGWIHYNVRLYIDNEQDWLLFKLTWV